jgi:hypothetical protein
VTNQVYIDILLCSLLLWSLCFIVTKHFKIISTSSQLILSVPDEGYFSNVSHTLHLISTFVIVLLGQISSTKFYVVMSMLALHLISTLLLGFLRGRGRVYIVPPIRLSLISVYQRIFAYFSLKSTTFTIL